MNCVLLEILIVLFFCTVALADRQEPTQLCGGTCEGSDSNSVTVPCSKCCVEKANPIFYPTLAFTKGKCFDGTCTCLQPHYIYKGLRLTADTSTRKQQHKRQKRSFHPCNKIPNIWMRLGCTFGVNMIVGEILNRTKDSFSKYCRTCVATTCVSSGCIDPMMSNPEKLDPAYLARKSDDLAKIESMMIIKTNDTSSETSTNSEKFTSRQWVIVGILACANLFSTSIFTCIAPFFPSEAQKKGLTTTETGIIFGIYELIMLIAFPLFGKYMYLFNPKKVFFFGLFFAGINTVIFGLVNLLPDGAVFFWTSLVIRCAASLGSVAFMISSFTICVQCFPGRISIVIGIIESSMALGVSFGSVAGGVLYEYGGFRLTFFVMGALLILVAVLSIFFIEKFDGSVNESDKGKGMLGVLKIPAIWIMIFAVIISALSITFLGPTLADHLASFHFSTTRVGLMFFILQIVCTISAPIFGIVLDRWQHSNAVLIFGAVTTAISMLLIGPSPLLSLEKNVVLIAISLAILGVGSEGLYIPTYKYCLETVKEYGYEDTSKASGYLSGIIMSAFAFGCFIGPTFGAFGVERIGFGWTTTVIAFINVAFVPIMITFLVIKSKVNSYSSQA